MWGFPLMGEPQQDPNILQSLVIIGTPRTGILIDGNHIGIYRAYIVGFRVYCCRGCYYWAVGFRDSQGFQDRVLEFAS